MPIIISGFALGFVFVPLSTVSLGGLKPSEIGNGSGLFNLLRNVGGSVGISVVNTILARHEQLHRSELSRNLVTTSHNLQQRLTELTQFLTQTYGPAEAARRVYGLVEGNADATGNSLVFCRRSCGTWRSLASVVYLSFGRLKRMKTERPGCSTLGPCTHLKLRSPT